MSEHTDLLTIRDMIRFATSRFNEAGLYYGHGTDNAWDEATQLILHSLHLSQYYDNPQILDARLTQAEKQGILVYIHRRIDERIPLGYLINEAWFGDMTFYVDERVLIPRSPIAELIEQQFQPWIEPKNVQTILDLCTGSGCIAIACAYAFPQALVDASDISTDALAVANINCLRHHVEEQVTLYESDLFSAIPNKQYHIIVSNPPYVSAQEMAELPEEYLHEPQLGLAAGQAGLDIVMRIIKNAADYLTDDGILVVEVGNSEHALSALLPDVAFTWLEFNRGGNGVFLLTATQVRQLKSQLI
jgi:ribosomal protein L3 glutamine methyltransferase